MENSPLNLAHREHRKAQHHICCGRFDEAGKSHVLAAKHLEDALSSLSHSSRAYESLQLQHEYHLRQLKIISLKKAQFEILKKAFANKKKIMAHVKEKTLEGERKDNEQKILQTAIYRTMEEADSLFELFANRGGPSGDGVENISNLTINDEHVLPPSCEGSKCPKNPHVVVEELHTLNQQLRSLVEQLMNQLDVYERENKALRTRIIELESEHEKCGKRCTLKKETSGLQVITDSSGGIYSPFVLSPMSQSSPEVTEASELPPLAPLEIPKFDYLMGGNTNSGN